MTRAQLLALARSRGWTVEIEGSFSDGYEVEVTAPEGFVIAGTDSDYQYLSQWEALPLADLLEEVRYLIEDLGCEEVKRRTGS